MDKDWAPEPLNWDAFENDIWDTTLERYVIDEPTRVRIKACYDACRGIPTRTLVNIGKGGRRLLIYTDITHGDGITSYKEVTNGHDNIGPPAHDNFRWFPDPEDL